jgi:hypothetical protein
MNTGNFLGPLLSRRGDSPADGRIHVAVSKALIAAAILAGVYRHVCSWKKAHRNNAGITRESDNAFNHDLTNMKNPQLRNMLCLFKREVCFLSQALFHGSLCPSGAVDIVHYRFRFCEDDVYQAKTQPLENSAR